MILFLHFLKVLCLSSARRRPSYALDPHSWDHMVVKKVASIMLLNRSTIPLGYFKTETSNTEWLSRLAKLAKVVSI